MPQRLVGVLLVVLMAVGAAGPALAVEATEAGPAERGPAPSIEEIGTQNEVSGQFLPERAEPPAFFRFFNLPLIALAVVAIALLLLTYLVWQPRFAQERRSRRRRR